MPHSWDDTTLPGGPPAEPNGGSPSLDAQTLPNVRTPELREQEAREAMEAREQEAREVLGEIPPPAPDAGTEPPRRPSSLPPRRSSIPPPLVPGSPELNMHLARVVAQTTATRTTLERQVRETTQLRSKVERNDERLRELEDERDHPRTLAELVRFRVRVSDLEAALEKARAEVIALSDAVARERAERELRSAEIESLRAMVEALTRVHEETQRRLSAQENALTLLRGEDVVEGRATLRMTQATLDVTLAPSELGSLQRGMEELRERVGEGAQLATADERATLAALAARVSEVEQLSRSLHDAEATLRAQIRRIDSAKTEPGISTMPVANEDLMRLAETIREESTRFSDRASRFEKQLEDHDERLEQLENLLEGPAMPSVDITASDDLRRIPGIGPAFERRLHTLGVRSYKQVAEWRAGDIAQIAAKLGVQADRIVRGRWVESARREHAKKYGRTGSTE